MNVLLGHLDFMPVLYGFIMFLGLLVMLHKLLNGSWLSLAVDVGVFTLVFSLHGGTMSGGFAAMICALISGLIFPSMIRRKLNS